MNPTLAQFLDDLAADPAEMMIELERNENTDMDAGDEVPGFSLVLHVADGAALVASGRIDGDGNAASVTVRCFVDDTQVTGDLLELGGTVVISTPVLDT